VKLRVISWIMALVGIFLWIGSAGAQPAVEWQTPYGGPMEEYASSIVRDAQGNAYVLGTVYNDETYADILLVKYSPQGQILWSQEFDTGLANDDAGFEIKVDSAGNVYVAGATHVGLYYEDVDLLLVKYDASGSLAWFRTWDGPENAYDAGFALTLDPSGSPVVAGVTQQTTTLYGLEFRQDEFLTIKYTADGDVQWTRTYAGPQGDGGRATAITSDAQGNVYVAGGAIIYGEYVGHDILTLKYAPDGTPLWTAQYESRSSYIIEPELGLNGPADQISLDAEGNVLVLGTTSLESSDPGYDSDVVVLKYTQDGTRLWKQIYGLRGEETANNLVTDSAGNIYVAADTPPFNPRGFDDQSDAVVFALGADGTLLWDWVFNGPDNGEDANTQVVLDGAGQPYAAFYTQTADSYDMGVVKFGADGSTEWLYRFDSPNGDHDVFASVVSDGADGLLFGLWTVGIAEPNLLAIKMRTSGGEASPPVLSITIDPAEIKPIRSEMGFEPTVQGIVTLSQPAPAGGTVVNLSGNNPAIDVPKFAIVSAGQTQATFEANVNGVDEDTVVTVTAQGGGGSDTATVRVLSAALREFSLSADEVIGGVGEESQGSTVFGFAYLDAWAGPSGANVSLSTNRPDIVTLPESVMIGPNDDWNAVVIETTGVSEATDVVISATYKGVTLQRTLRVLPARVAYVTLFGENFSSYLPGGVPVNGQVILEGRAPAGGLVVTLSSDSPNLIVPATVTVPAGERIGTFSAQTLPTAEFALTVTATASSGGNEAQGTLTLHRPIVRQVQLNPEAVVGGTSAEGTVVLDGPAPEGGIEVSLTSDNAAASVPSTVTVPAGSASVNFPITTTAIEEPIKARITARDFGSASATIAIVREGDIPDTVTINSVGYSSTRRRRNRLNVVATSTSRVATLRVYNADTNAFIGTLTYSSADGTNGRYTGSLFVSPKPARIIVRSSLGGSATAAVP
jgi:hypothetical protein